MKIRVALALALLAFFRDTTFAQQSKKTMHATGRVTAIAPDSISVKSGANTLTFAVDSSTKVTGKGVGTKTRALKEANKSPQVTDLIDEHDSVVVEYHDLGGGKLHAAEIRIRAKSFKKQ